MILAGDIGGTNTRLALFQEDASTLVRQDVFQNAGHKRFQGIANDFLLEDERARVGRACFGVAGAVRAGAVDMTNLGWRLDERTLQQELGIAKVALINDMVAHAENIDRLSGDQVQTIRAGKPVPEAGGAVIIPGTGLGEAGLFFDARAGRHRGFATEGGHTDFGPASEREEALLRYLRKNDKCTSWEALVSGPGLRVIYDFLIDEANVRTKVDFGQEGPRPEQITQEARAGTCPACVQAVRWFVELYGAEAGNLALKTGAIAGVWLGGKIAQAVAELLATPLFFERFGVKGPPAIRQMLADIPVHLIRFELNGLYGAAAYAREM